MLMYATVVKKSPQNSIMAVTIALRLPSRETNREAATPLVIHTDTKAFMTPSFCKLEASSPYSEMGGV